MSNVPSAAAWASLLVAAALTASTCGALQRARAAFIVASPPRDNPFHRSGSKSIAGFVPIGLATLAAVLFLRGPVPAMGLMAAVVGLALVGAIDDRHKLTPGQKVLAQLPVFVWIEAVAAPFGAPRSPSVLVFQIGYLIVATNAFNVVDVADGLAPGIATISLGASALLLSVAGEADLAVVAAAFCGGTAGFLWHNVRGTVILGDCGSLALGGLLATLAPRCISGRGPTAVAVAALLLFVPLSEVVWLSACRICMRTPPWKATPDHVAYRLAARGMPTPQAVAVLLSAQAIAASAAVWIGGATSWSAWMLAIAIGVAVAGWA
jgi:UDP-N-acetylmuramyl pentapeptide phosphotransferase/UDP-N-acetylglucosamine-1-phosphate transferase